MTPKDKSRTPRTDAIEQKLEAVAFGALEMARELETALSAAQDRNAVLEVEHVEFYNRAVAAESRIKELETAHADAIEGWKDVEQRLREEQDTVEQKLRAVEMDRDYWKERADRLAATPTTAAQPWTPKEAKRLQDFHDAAILEDLDAAYNAIYWLVSDRAADPYRPWDEVEAAAALNPKEDKGGKEC